MLCVTPGFSVSVHVSVGTHRDVGESTSLSQLSQGAKKEHPVGCRSATWGVSVEVSVGSKENPQRKGRLGQESTCSSSPKIHGFSFTMQIQGFIRK